MNYDNFLARLDILSEIGKIPHCTMLVSSDEKQLLNAAKDLSMSILSFEKSPEEKASISHRYDSGSLVDVVQVTKDTATTISIASIRNVIRTSYDTGIDFDKKIYILHSAQDLGEVSQNALLKILEEPPQSVYFILLALSTASILETIKSRCQVFDISVKEIRGQLFPMEEELLGEFEKLLSLEEYAPFSFADKLSKREDIKKNLELMMDYFCDVMIFAKTKDDKMLKWLYNKNMLDILRFVSRNYPLKSIMNLLESINKGIQSVEANVSKQLLSEAMLLRIQEELNAKSSRSQI